MVGELLEREPYLFEFFQAVRLLERLMPDREPVGRFVNPRTEVVRFGANPSHRLSRPARSRRCRCGRRRHARSCASTSWGSPARWGCCRSTTPSW